MDKYIRVAWPESQEWMDQKYYDEGVEFSQSCGTTVFVPEELYKKVHSRRLPPDAPRCKNCEHCVKGNTVKDSGGKNLSARSSRRETDYSRPLPSIKGKTVKCLNREKENNHENG